MTRYLTVCLLCGLLKAAAPIQSQEGGNPATPTVSTVLETYVTSIGGESAIRRHTTRLAVGALVTPGGKAPLEVRMKAPDKFLVRMEPPSGLSENGFDGVTPWSRNAGVVRDRTGPDVGFVRRENMIHRAIEWTRLYPTISVARADRLGDRRAWVLTAVAADGQAETQYFDAATGRLLGIDVTIAGTSMQVRYDDYRLVDDVWLPFAIHRSRPDFTWSETYREMTHDVPLSDSLFAKPAG